MGAELSSLDDQRRFGVTTFIMHEFEREVVDCVVPTSGLREVTRGVFALVTALRPLEIDRDPPNSGPSELTVRQR